jgi:hypothetical protein
MLFVLLQTFLLFSLELGSIKRTVLHGHNFALLFWLIAFVLFVFFTNILYLRNCRTSGKRIVRHS